jgi:hypothetical protein
VLLEAVGRHAGGRVANRRLSHAGPGRQDGGARDASDPRSFAEASLSVLGVVSSARN